jgi:hypothetical protein
MTIISDPTPLADTSIRGRITPPAVVTDENGVTFIEGALTSAVPGTGRHTFIFSTEECVTGHPREWAVWPGDRCENPLPLDELRTYATELLAIAEYLSPGRRA